MRTAVRSACTDSPGKGSWFEVWLPVDRRTPHAASTAESDGAEAFLDIDSPPWLQGLRLLIVDDDEDAIVAARANGVARLCSREGEGAGCPVD